MASLIARSLMEDDVIKGMSTELAVMLTSEGKKERKAWEDLHTKVADVAASMADPTNTIEDLLSTLIREMGSLVLGYPEAEVLLRRILVLIEEKVRAGSAHASTAISLLKSLILLLAGELNMIPLCNSKHLHMVDESATFSKKNVDELFKYSLDLCAPNSPYTVVSIVGAQSSGKSYLLNQLFKTKFPVMDRAFGWTQTTKGILMSRCIEPSMLVLEIEGFDGREKGKDTFLEEQAALFALTVSDLMMVNISMYDMGREQGGGGSLFKTIFRERTKLPSGLTNIVVVIRCYNGQVQFESLRKDVIEALEEIWKSVNKEPTTFRNYFKINVVALPEEVKECFPKEVTALRKLLSNITTSAKVPASSFSRSSKMLWDQIKQNKKLDLESHMMILAKLYCQETVEAYIAQFDYKLLKSEESPQGFKEVSNKLLSKIITQYNQETDMYDGGIREKVCQNMIEKINKIFQEHSGELLRKILEDSSIKFKEEFAREFEILEKTNDDVINYDDHKVESCVEKFMNTCGDLKVFDLDNFHTRCEDLRKQLTSYRYSRILSLKDQRARKAAEKQQISEKTIEGLTMKLDQITQEKQRLEEEATKATEKQKSADKRTNALTMQLDEMTQERQFLEERASKVAEQQQMAGRKIELLTTKLDQRTQETQRLQECARKAAERQQRSDKEIQVLTMKLDKRTQESQRRALENEIQEQENNNSGN